MYQNDQNDSNKNYMKLYQSYKITKEKGRKVYLKEGEEKGEKGEEKEDKGGREMRGKEGKKGENRIGRWPTMEERRREGEKRRRLGLYKKPHPTIAQRCPGSLSLCRGCMRHDSNVTHSPRITKHPKPQLCNWG